MKTNSLHFNQTDSTSHPSVAARGPSKAGLGTNQSNPTHLSKAVRKDPAVFPLGLIVGGVVLVAGYFLLQKAPKEGGGKESFGSNKPPSMKSVYYPFDKGLYFDSIPQCQPLSKFFLGKK
ncbi:hypothetical protein CROQUDRAFT_719900 [Cronartium quercuum f. sp. fusiforme G11]|uniref:Transmembrane protein n=1 Tax=Cronartium quercuum f. sp. fusiforme G11 TaxID=708437 RepID=A0A9P6TI55_9BASI|nr:hypothetical protein CROQUDRAFT_719900 [Cronartium quercuum f. sp. fusiforme G11]